jgi:PEP-CTERM motif
MKPIPQFALFLVLASAGMANTIFQLDRDACTGTCGTGPFATITLSQTSPTTVTVAEVLSPDEVFARTGAGQALEFNVSGTPVFGDITPGFALGPAGATASAFGDFLYSITCIVCKGGNLTNPSGPLSFTVSSAEGVSIADFLPNDRGYYFASDIRGNNGNTGNVATKILFFTSDVGSAAAEVPEPAALILIGGGLIGLSIMHRRRAG